MNVTVRLKGGLGNQMFQYAAALAASRDGNLPLIDTVYLADRTPRRDFTYRNFELDVFGIKGPRTFLSEIAENVPIPGLWLAGDMALERCQRFFGVRTVNESNWDKIVLEREAGKAAHADILLDDYFQSERFFAAAADKVRRAFRFSREPEPEVAQLLQQIHERPSVDINVRGGDYLNLTNRSIFNSLDRDYYRAAYLEVVREEPDAIFYLITNDPKRAQEVLVDIPKDKIVFVDAEVSGLRGAEYLRIMSACKHHIIANSSFSWWGSWLSQSRGLTIAPAHWYVAEGRNTSDLTPSSWMRL
jgi:hypothetical protein